MEKNKNRKEKERERKRNKGMERVENIVFAVSYRNRDRPPKTLVRNKATPKHKEIDIIEMKKFSYLATSKKQHTSAF